jgi:hypothetical protein
MAANTSRRTRTQRQVKNTAALIAWMQSSDAAAGVKDGSRRRAAVSLTPAVASENNRPSGQGRTADLMVATRASRDLVACGFAARRDDRAVAFERVDLGIGKTVLAEHAAGVLAVERRAGAHLAGGRREPT